MNVRQIIEAQNLRPLSIESKSYPDTCCKVTLYDRHGKRIKRKKTSVQRTSDCPIFNENLVFELRRDIASEVIIEVRLVHESLSYKAVLRSFGQKTHVTLVTKSSIFKVVKFSTSSFSASRLHDLSFVKSFVDKLQICTGCLAY